MARMLSLAIEPSDVLLGLLRLRASTEAGRWPRGVSKRFRASTEREFVRLEPCVRAIGVCYAALEERSVAELDRRPQSRFADVDGALHLAACSIEIGVDLDHLRMAVDRGDASVRESASSLATALRNVLWYAVHSDLLVCPLALLGGADVGPDRALVFIDAYLSGAWLHARPPDPPLPIESPGTDSARAPIALDDHAPLPFTESTAVFKQSSSQEPPSLDDQPTLETVGDELTAPADVLGANGRAHLAAAYQHHDALDVDDTYSRSMHPGLHGDQYTVPGRPLPDVLPPDALFFLDESGAPWPCNARQLSAARAVLIVRTPAPGADARQSAAARAWIERVERGFAELRQRLSP
jgi:hypothetical protein